MTSTETILLMLVLSAACLIALWHSVEVINRMGPQTHHGVRWAYILKASGMFGVLLSALDFMHGDPMAWPWLLLVSVTVQLSGSALLHVVTRRLCRCPECPIRNADICIRRAPTL